MITLHSDTDVLLKEYAFDDIIRLTIRPIVYARQYVKPMYLRLDIDTLDRQHRRLKGAACSSTIATEPRAASIRCHKRRRVFSVPPVTNNASNS